VALGYGSLYNHSYSPNARYLDVGRMTKAFISLRDIAPGEEITINYNADPHDMADVGFEVAD
jgi:SET domain-containing protein